MTVSNWTEDRFDWREASASIRNTLGESFLFEVSNFVDLENTDISTIYVSLFFKFIFKEENIKCKITTLARPAYFRFT